MTREDEYELAWWRQFRLKFRHTDIPHMGSPLLGYRLVVCVDGPDGLVPWSER